MDVVSADKSVNLSKKRKLKKLYRKVRQQIEFYFSDSNVVKDKFLQNLIEGSPNGYVDVEVFKSFNKIKVLTQDVDVIATALFGSNVLQVSDDGKKVKRVTPINFNKDFDACTIYVERLPLHADYKWIKDVFEHFGTVSYINVPRFKASNRIKGFSFIEFESPESVKKACEFYKNLSQKENGAVDDENGHVKAGKKKCSDEILEKKMRKNKLRSVSESYEKAPSQFLNSHEQKDYQKDDKIKLDISKRKRRNSETDLPSKKLKVQNNDENYSVPLSLDMQKLEESMEIKEVHTMSTEENSSEAMGNSTKPCTSLKNEELSNKSKRKRKNNRKNQISDHPPLRVMSKAEWKVYRNKYLELQRATMSHLKKTIMLQTQELREQDNTKAVDSTDSTRKGLQFQPGVIVKINLTESVKNSSDIKDQVKANATVAYVDVPMDQSEIYVRCHTPEEALSIINEGKLQHLGSTKLLQDEEETSYWKKIDEGRKFKFSNPVLHKKRGREKIIAKAMKLEELKNKHIFFDE